MTMQQALRTLAQGRDLEHEMMQAAMREMMSGETTPAQIGAFLMALHLKGETVTEIHAAAEVMRALAVPVQVGDRNLVDTCGTGGDGASLFNVSTGAALVAAAGGARVAKHGNRAASSHSGSADVLEALGVRIDLAPEAVARCIEELGIGFLFAQHHHGAMKHAIGPRRELGLRTIFNLLGPLSNPAAARRQLLGVFDSRWLRPLAEVLQQLGSLHVLVLHSEDGLDEISIAARTRVAELRDGVIREYEIDPEEYGLRRQSLEGLQVQNPQQSAALLRTALAGEGPAAELLALNGGAALYAADLAVDLGCGVELAQDTLHSGQALEKLHEWVQYSAMLAEPRDP